jgi:hypothetical protein
VRGNAIDGLRKLEEEAPFGKYAKVAQAEWAERARGGLRVKRPDRTSFEVEKTDK